MNFKEYLNQKDPQPHIRVEVRREDCVFLTERPLPGIKYRITLAEGNSWCFDYLVDYQSNWLWTTDNDGNKKTISCFVFVEEDET